MTYKNTLLPVCCQNFGKAVKTLCSLMERTEKDLLTEGCQFTGNLTVLYILMRQSTSDSPSRIILLLLECPCLRVSMQLTDKFAWLCCKFYKSSQTPPAFCSQWQNWLLQMRIELALQHPVVDILYESFEIWPFCTHFPENNQWQYWQKFSGAVAEMSSQDFPMTLRQSIRTSNDVKWKTFVLQLHSIFTGTKRSDNLEIEQI